MKKISCAILYSLLSFSANVSSETVNEMDVQSTDHLHYSTYILVKRGVSSTGTANKLMN